VRAKAGWGGRIRTFEYGIQSPAPYRLATPHSLLRGPCPPDGASRFVGALSPHFALGVFTPAFDFAQAALSLPKRGPLPPGQLTPGPCPPDASRFVETHRPTPHNPADQLLADAKWKKLTSGVVDQSLCNR
jgi:hypothetical protein